MRHALHPTPPPAPAHGALKTALLMAALAGIAALVGHVILGRAGLIIGGAATLLLAGIGLPLPARAMMRFMGARPLPPHLAPELHAMVARLAARAGVPPPALYLLPSPEPNALTTVGGDGRGAIAVTEPLLLLLDGPELEGVIAHEVAHLLHRDTAVMQMATVVARVVLALIEAGTWVALFAVIFTGQGFRRVMLLALLGFGVPILLNLLIAALSRTRELAADATAAWLTGRPLALAAALSHLSRAQHRLMGALLGRPLAPAALRSHPPTRERIERLRAMAEARGDPDRGWRRPVARPQPADVVLDTLFPGRWRGEP